MPNYFTDAEVDQLLAEVEQQVGKLAKNAPPKPGDEGNDDAPPMGGDPAAAAPGAAPAAPAPGAGAPPAGAPDPAAAGADPAAGGDPAAAGQDGGDQALADDGQGGEELSDQELHQIYSSMDPADLERHYMVIRSCLRTTYQKFEKSESNSNKEEEMSKEQIKKFEDEIAALKKSNKEQEEALAGALKAVEIMAKPTRKAVVGTVEVINKSEADKTGAGADTSTLTKAEIVAKIGEKVKDHTLSKDDRTAMNRYVLSKTEEGREKVLSILGGKK